MNFLIEQWKREFKLKYPKVVIVLSLEKVAISIIGIYTPRIRSFSPNIFIRKIMEEIIVMRDKERLAESKFKEWLDEHKIPHWYIQQDIDSFSPALKRYATKRPDFMVLVPHVGFIITDVEYKKPAEKHEVFFIDEKQTRQYCNLQNYFNLQVWYVFSNEISHFNTWFWIPASKVLEMGKLHTESKTKRRYCSVPLTKFISVSKTDNLGRLFSEMPKFF